MNSEYNIEPVGPGVLILSLDTTTRSGSVAIACDGRVIHEQAGDASLPHAQRLPADLITACRGAGIEIGDVGLFAVAAGPGSFTGLRIGIATVQGLAMAWGRRVVPVPTLEAIASAAPGEAPRIAAWMDAMRGEVFAQVFEREGHRVRAVSDAISAVPQAVLAAHETALAGAAFHGDGAVRYRDVIAGGGVESSWIADRVPPLAGALALIAFHDPDRAVLPHAIVPVYVRRPDVEIARDRRAGEA